MIIFVKRPKRPLLSSIPQILLSHSTDVIKLERPLSSFASSRARISILPLRNYTEIFYKLIEQYFFNQKKITCLIHVIETHFVLKKDFTTSVVPFQSVFVVLSVLRLLFQNFGRNSVQRRMPPSPLSLWLHTYCLPSLRVYYRALFTLQQSVIFSSLYNSSSLKYVE